MNKAFMIIFIHLYRFPLRLSRLQFVLAVVVLLQLWIYGIYGFDGHNHDT